MFGKNSKMGQKSQKSKMSKASKSVEGATESKACSSKSKTSAKK